MATTKPRPKLTRWDALDAIPVRNQLCRVEQTDEGLVRVIAPIRETLVIKLMKRLTYGSKYKKIELDEIGTFVWKQCDGRTNVRTLVDTLCKRYKLSPREGEAALTQYLRTLGRRGLIGLAVTAGPNARRP